jgi:hypothetical protein
VTNWLIQGGGQGSKEGSHLGMLLKIFTFGPQSPLILDVFEHTFMIDDGLKRADYIGAFFKNIKWEAVDD